MPKPYGGPMPYVTGCMPVLNCLRGAAAAGVGRHQAA